MTTEAQKRARAKWNAANQKKLNITFSAAEYDALSAAADSEAVTIQAIIRQSLRAAGYLPEAEKKRDLFV